MNPSFHFTSFVFLASATQPPRAHVNWQLSKTNLLIETVYSWLTERVSGPWVKVVLSLHQSCIQGQKMYQDECLEMIQKRFLIKIAVQLISIGLNVWCQRACSWCMNESTDNHRPAYSLLLWSIAHYTDTLCTTRQTTLAALWSTQWSIRQLKVKIWYRFLPLPWIPLHFLQDPPSSASDRLRSLYAWLKLLTRVALVMCGSCGSKTMASPETLQLRQQKRLVCLPGQQRLSIYCISISLLVLFYKPTTSDCMPLV